VLRLIAITIYDYARATCHRTFLQILFQTNRGSHDLELLRASLSRSSQIALKANPTPCEPAEMLIADGVQTGDKVVAGGTVTCLFERAVPEIPYLGIFTA